MTIISELLPASSCFTAAKLPFDGTADDEDLIDRRVTFTRATIRRALADRDASGQRRLAPEWTTMIEQAERDRATRTERALAKDLAARRRGSTGLGRGSASGDLHLQRPNRLSRLAAPPTPYFRTVISACTERSEKWVESVKVGRDR
jgi:hypothetical protein